MTFAAGICGACSLVLLGALFVPSRARADGTAGAQPFDAAPFAGRIFSDDKCDLVLRWNEARNIRRVEVEFDSGTDASRAESVRLQYWLRHWKGVADTPASETNPAQEGWRKADDWTNGEWKDADARIKTNGAVATFLFAPTNEKEFPALDAPGVTFRKTLQLRLHGDAPLPKIKAVRAFTDNVLQPVSVRIAWDDSLLEKLKFEGAEEVGFEAYNGKILSVRAPAGSPVTVHGGRAVIPPGMRGSVELQLAGAVETPDAAGDGAVITVRSARRPFSFALQELLQGRKILVADLGVLVTKGDDATGIAEWRATLRELGRKTVYDRVAESAGQTLAQAWGDMPLKRPLNFVHGLPGNRNVVEQYADGNLVLGLAKPRADWQAGGGESRRLWNGRNLRFNFGFPEDRDGRRELLEGWLPVLRTCWQEGPLFYEQTAFLGKLDGDINRCALDDTTVLRMRVRIVNTSGTETAEAILSPNARAEVSPASKTHVEWDRLEFEGERVFGNAGASRHFRFLFRTAGGGRTEQSGNSLRWTMTLGPGQSHDLYFAIPTLTLATEDEIAALSRRDFDDERRAVVGFWRNLNPHATRITTPEPWLNDFYKAHMRHLEVNCLADSNPQLSRRFAVVGSTGYGVYPNESVMMISDLDRRGLHKAAEDCLQSLIDFQGTVPLPGDFKSAKGVYYGADGLEMAGYNKNHGYVLWALAEHWKFTRDRAWMERVTQSILEACEWIIQERKATMKLNPDGGKPIEYGFLPAGSLEDVSDCWHWQATNTATVWGFDAIAEAMADYGHPDAQRLLTEAKAYHDDVMRGLTEARILAPVVRLRDGTYVPHYPSHLHLRGRAIGWIRETLEGPMYLPAYGLLAPDAPETAWILKDYEDNLYISERYGYAIPAFEKYWFSRGGFSMQANLLDGPLPYLYRDDIKHYLRAFFNGFASAFYPETRMLNEHSKPELGVPAGDHFKTSDEAQVAGWLRLMFVRESGETLYLGQAIPREWLKDGARIGIQNAATYFGPMSLEYRSHLNTKNQITVDLEPPLRNPPRTICLRLRHPESKPIAKVTLNGAPWENFDAAKEWIILPGALKSRQTVVVSYY